MKLPANQREDTQSEPSQSPLPAAKPPIIHIVFIGTDGLRAGWSLAIFIALIALMAALLKGASAVGKRMHLLPVQAAGTKEISFAVGLFAESLPLLALFLVTWIMSKIEKRPNSVYGLGGKHRLPQFFMGLASGVTCLSFLVLILWKTGLLVFDRRLLFGTDVLRYGIMWVLGFLVVGLFEEYLNRGYLLFTLTRGLAGIYSWLFKARQSKALGFWTGALTVSLLFGLGHGTNPGESPIGLLSAGLGSFVFCLSLWRTGSLWWAIGFHASWDWAQSFLYGVADSGLMVEHHLLATHALGRPLMSGGSTGPEGSIFVLPLLAVISLIIMFTLPHTGYANVVFKVAEDRVQPLTNAATGQSPPIH
jgi:membrane protease YdiL (CAAX protease family)